MSWILNEEVFTFCRAVEHLANKWGYHVALGGSTLHVGNPSKDLDLIVYTRRHRVDATPGELKEFIAALRVVGIQFERYDGPDYGGWRTVYYGQNSAGQRVDLLFV